MNFTRDRYEGALYIYINSIVHLVINTTELVNVRSWYISADKDPDPYFIELTYKTTKVICQYDTLEKWKGVLEMLKV